MSDYQPIERPLGEHLATEAGPYMPTVVPQTDVLRRDRVPSTEGMELEYREYASAPMDAYFLTSIVPGWLFVILLINSLVFSPLQRYTESALTSVLMWPFWIFLSVGLGNRITRLTEDGRLIAACFVVPLLTPIVLDYFYAPPIGSDVQSGIVIFAVVVMGVVSDRMATHYYYFMTANPGFVGEDGIPLTAQKLQGCS